MKDKEGRTKVPPDNRERLLEEILNVFSDTGVLVLDGEGKIVLFSPGAERLYGYERGEVLGHPAEDLLEAPLEDEEDELNMETLLCEAEDRGKLEFDIPQKRKDGTVFGARISYHPRGLPGQESRPGSIVLVENLEEVGRLRQMKKDFLTIVSHELRTPLTSIKGAVSVLTEGACGSLKEDQSSFLTIIERNTEKLLELVSNLLDTTKLEAGRLRFSFVPINICKILREVEDHIQNEFPNKRVILIHREEGKTCRISADPSRIEQVCHILLENAFKFSENGGTVTITARGEEDRVIVSIRDEGQGIAPGEHLKVFEKFYQVDSSATRQIGGMGLGLYMARKILSIHQGRIWLESEPGKGTTMWFTLPRVLNDV